MNGYDIPNTYTALGIDISKLGCVMLQVKSPDLSELINPEWAYYSPNLRYAQGFDKIGDHITLLYGLLENANTWKEHVDTVLEGWEPELIEPHYVDHFASANGEPYGCIVLKIYKSYNLLDAHNRLSLLPHIDTFPYEPHLTIGYVKEEVVEEVEWVFEHAFEYVDLEPVGLDYGRPPSS